jgi:hypothetical protein
MRIEAAKKEVLGTKALAHSFIKVIFEPSIKIILRAHSCWCHCTALNWVKEKFPHELKKKKVNKIAKHQH